MRFLILDFDFGTSIHAVQIHNVTWGLNSDEEIITKTDNQPGFGSFSSFLKLFSLFAQPLMIRLSNVYSK